MNLNKVVPVEYHRENLIKSIQKFQITIIQAETGSGKTIFVPKILYFSKLFKKIFVSQTKRAAAIGASSFLSWILNEKIGETIGYSVRFENKSTKNSKIRFVTDGILFQNLLNNFLIEKNTCIILDEFHERTLHSDLLICLLKKILNYRKDLKLIFMSASGDSTKIAEYFKENVGKIDIPGNLFEIKTFYSKYVQLDFIVSLCSVITKLHFQEKINSDFLVFCPGYKEILECEQMLRFIFEKKCENFIIFKLHSNLPLSEQITICNSISFQKRKIILSTNIAESSLTIKGVKFVFDSGFSKQKILNWKTGFDLYKIFPISKSEAKQRAGRAGRIKNGKCFRIFTYIDYTHFQNFPRPEIQRSDLSMLFLHIFSSRFSSLFTLDFIDIPPCWLVKRSLENLFVLGAIDRKLNLTSVGRLLALYPIEIKLSKCLTESLATKNKQVQLYILLSCSILSTSFNIFNLKENYYRKNLNIIFKKSIISEECFFIAIVFKEFLNLNTKAEKYIWCQIQNIDFHLFDLADNIKQQLSEINRLSFEFFRLRSKKVINYKKALDGFRYYFTSGFFQNSARIISYSDTVQIIVSGILATLFGSKKERNKGDLFLFYELSINKHPFINGLISTRLPWLLYWGNCLFY